MSSARRYARGLPEYTHINREYMSLHFALHNPRSKPDLFAILACQLDSPLNIKKLQDVYENDLDLEYTVRDVFDDKSADQQNSVVRVLREPTARESSVPPQSALRPYIHGIMGRKRTHGGLGGLRDDMMGSVGRRGSEPRSGRSNKRQRIQEISRVEEEEVDPDLPLPSMEPNSEAVGDPMQWTGAGQEDPPRQAMGDSQQPRIGDSQARMWSPGKPLHQLTLIHP